MILDPRLLSLALGTFAIGTGSFVFAGLLRAVAGDLSVSVRAAGQLITVYALVYALLSPVLVTLTSSVPRRRLLVVSLTVFATANVAALVVPSYGLLMLSRVVAAAGGAAFTPTAAAVAANLVAPEYRGRALATVTGGLTVAFAFGIPAGTLVGDSLGWRSAFLVVGVLGACALVGLRAIPGDAANPARVSLAERAAAVRRPAVLVVLALTAIGLGSGFIVFAYVDPLLGKLTGLGGRGLSALLLVFGVAGIAGNALGGYGADRYGYRRSAALIFSVLILCFVGFSLLALLPASPLTIVGSGIVLIGWSLAGWGLTPFQQYRLVELAPENPNVLLSLNASAIYLGQGAGAAIGAVVLSLGPPTNLGWVSALFAAIGLALISASGRPRRVP